MTIEIHKLVNFKMKNPIMIVGLPGTGLVGSISASYLVDALNMDFVGYITSPEFAPLAAIHDYKPLPPARIHYSKKLNLLVVLSEMSIPIGASMDLASSVLALAKSVKAKSIISLGGIALKENPKALYAISTNDKLSEYFFAGDKCKKIREGATTGVSGVLLTMGVVEKFPVLLLLAEASEDYMDPGAASNILKLLSQYLKVDIDTKKLDKESKELASSLRDTVVKSKIPYKKSSMGSMYG